MSLQQSLGLGVEITLQDRFSPVATKVISSYTQMRSAIVGGAHDISRAGMAMSQSVGGMAGAAVGKRGNKTGGGGSGLASMQSVIGGVAMAMGALKGLGAGFHAFDDIADSAGRFDKQVASAGAIMRANATDMKLLEKAAIKAGIDTQFSPIEAAEGLQLLAQSGYNAQEATALLNPTLDLAAGGQISVAQAAATTSAAVKIFGLNMSQAKEATDKLLRISNATALTAGDLQLGLGNVSRGAVVAGQSIDEMLPAMGLIKNAGLDVSVSSSAVSSALLMMGKNSKKFKDDLGVSVTNASGKFRPFLDVVQEAQVALEKKFPDAAERAAKSNELFSKFGLTAVSAIGAQLKNGITGANGQILKGTAAIAYLREQMATAGGDAGKNNGAAAEFKNRLLDTFEGQKTLLRGSMETLGVVVGQPLTKALRPAVEGVINVVNRLIAFVQDIPEPVKVVFAKMALGAAVLGSAALSILAFGAAVAAIGGPIVEVIGAMGTLAPIAAGLGAVFGLVGLGAAGLKVGIESNVGGIGDYLSEKFNQVKLVIQGLVQVFSSGEISGPIADELGKAGNEGLLNFIGDIYSTFKQAGEFIDNAITGFKDIIKGAAPAFQELATAMDGVLANFSSMTEAKDPANVANGFNQSNEKGLNFGKTIGQVAVLMIQLLTIALDVTNGMIRGWGKVKGVVQPIASIFGEMWTSVAEITEEFNRFGASAEGSGGKAISAGTYIIGIFSAMGGFVVTALSAVKGMFTGLLNYFVGIGELIYGVLTLNWGMAWRGWKRIAFGAITMVISMVGLMVESLASAADYVAALGGVDLGAAKTVRGFKDGLLASIKEGMGLNVPVEIKDAGGGQIVPERLTAAPQDLFATNAAIDAGPQFTPPEDATSGTNSEALLAAVNALGRRPVEVKVSIDARAAASGVADASTDEANRSYADNSAAD